MVFVSKNKFRKCKYCNKPAKEAFGKIQNNGKKKKKGYYRTCGSKECLQQQYKDTYVCLSKSKLKKESFGICRVCGEKFKRECISHKYYCRECVPNNAWRGRAQRYGVGKKQWEKLLKKQNYKCALCDRNPEVIDHCHKTGKVRGLLCNKCNGNIKWLDMNDSFKKRSLKYIGEENVSIC